MCSTETNLEIGSERDLLPGIGDELWTARAPRLLAKRYRTVDDPAGWRTWRKHLRARHNPRPIAKLFPGRQSSLLWAMAVDPAGVATAELVERICHLARRPRDIDAQASLATEVENWIWSCDVAERSAPWALETLAWAQALPRLAAGLPAPPWWRLVHRLLALVRQGARTDTCSEPLVNQILAGELPLTLMYQFPELQSCQQLHKPAREALSRGLAEILDGEGLPQGAYLGILRPLWACWTRCRAIGGRATWDRESEVQFRQLSREMIRLSRADGSQVLARDETGAWTPKLFKLALQLADEKPLVKLSSLMLPPGKPLSASRSRIKAAPAVHSEWAEIAVLQPAWRRGGPKLSVVYAQQQTQIELELRGESLCSGCWEFDIRCDDTPVEMAASWEEVCWVSDADVDYLEIEAKLSGGVTVQRQIMLARKDRCLFLADAIIGPRPARLDYRGRLPVASTVKMQPAAETREVWLQGRKARAIVLPLALREWRADPRGGQLAESGGQLCLQQTAHGQHLYAPLLIDLDPKRADRGLTWRQLTIAESRQVQPAEVAVGFRAQAGKSQWLAYRSLAAPSVRTVLGQNLSSEFVFGRFGRNGDVKPLDRDRVSAANERRREPADRKSGASAAADWRGRHGVRACRGRGDSGCRDKVSAGRAGSKSRPGRLP